MNHSIKLEDHVYKRLQQFQDKRETYSQAIYRLLTLLDKVGELRNILEGQIKFAEWQKAQLEKNKAPDQSGDSPEGGESDHRQSH